MNGQRRGRGGQATGAGWLATVRRGGMAALLAFAVTALFLTAAGTARAQQRSIADGGVPAYITQASQGIVTPPDIEDVEHMCALLSSCSKLPLPPGVQISSVPSCVQALMGELTKPDALKFTLLIRECGLRSNSCNELRKCMMWGAADDVCRDRGKSGPAGRCDDEGRAINCSHEQVVGVRDCPRGGEQCVVREGQASCVLGPCTAENKEGSPPTCSASGTRILQCDHGKLTSFDCAAFGLKCSLLEGKVGCAPPTPACTGTSKRCDGNVSVGCLHGHEVRVDCGAAGLTCNGSPGATPVGACMAPAPDTDKCDPKDAGKCDGATIKYCFAGKKRSYFCKSLGFNQCVKDGAALRCGG